MSRLLHRSIAVTGLRVNNGILSSQLSTIPNRIISCIKPCVSTSSMISKFSYCNIQTMSHHSMTAVSNDATSATKPTIYGFPTSQPTRSVIMLCKEANIDFNYVEINVFKGQNRKPEYLQLNPTGLIPTWQDGSLSLGESAAIMLYLVEKFHLHHYYPDDILTRAKINFWLFWNHTNTRHGTELLKLTLYGQDPKDQKISERKKGFVKALETLESHFDSSKYLVGDSITIADFLIVPEIDQMMGDAYGLADFTPFPKVVAYVQNFRQTVKSYDESIAPIKAIAKRLQAKLHPPK